MYTQFTGRNAEIIARRIKQRRAEIELMHEICLDASETCIEQPPRTIYHQPPSVSYDVGMLDAWHPLYDRSQDPRVVPLSQLLGNGNGVE